MSYYLNLSDWFYGFDPLVIGGMRVEDRTFIASCCFPSLMALLVLQGHTDFAARILAKKLGIHPGADVNTSGRLLLQKFLKASAEKAAERNDEFYDMISKLWSGAIILDILNTLPSITEEALVLLDSQL